MNLEFPRSFAKNNPTSNFMKIRAVGAELFRADRRRDRRNISNFNIPHKGTHHLLLKR